MVKIGEFNIYKIVFAKALSIRFHSLKLPKKETYYGVPLKKVDFFSKVKKRNLDYALKVQNQVQ